MPRTYFYQDPRIIKKDMNKRWSIKWKALTIKKNQDMNVVASSVGDASIIQAINKGWRWMPMPWVNVVESGYFVNSYNPAATTAAPVLDAPKIMYSLILPLMEPVVMWYDKQGGGYLTAEAAVALEVKGQWQLTSKWEFRGKNAPNAELLTGFGSDGIFTYSTTSGFQGGIN